MKITTKMCLGLYLFAIGVIAAKRAVTEEQNLTLPAGWAVDCTCPTASSGMGYNACCRNGGDLAATSPEMCDKNSPAGASNASGQGLQYISSNLS